MPEVLGQFQAILNKDQKQSQQTIDLCHQWTEDKPARTSSNSIPPTCFAYQHPKQGKWRHFPRFLSFFQGLGNLGEEHQIILKDELWPHALFTPWNVPIALRHMVKKELEQMEKLGVISKVTTLMHSIVCQDGCGTQEVEWGSNLGSAYGHSPHTISWWRTLDHLSGVTMFSKVNVNSVLRLTDDFYHTIWALLL